MNSKARSRSSPALRAASAAPSRWSWPSAVPSVVGTATSEAGAAGISEALAAFGWRASCSTSPTGGARRRHRRHRQGHGGLHVLVNNAGITRDGLAMRMKDDDWDAVLDTNLKAVFRACRVAMRPMMKQRYGRIINITSVVGASRQPRPGQLCGGQGRRGRHDARAGPRTGQPQHHGQLRGAGLHRHRHDRRPARSAARRCSARSRWGAWATPEEIAGAVAFLASPQAGYITGAELHVNGGMFMN
jgi:3-oxoacyl-[acyl-carrier protein] reductase